jgi:transcription elongation GreA/GreB family factor
LAQATSLTSDTAFPEGFKSLVLRRYKLLVQDRIDAFADMIAALAEESRNDAKSSAGDKHETSLSMMQLEQEKLSAKLAEFLTQKSILEKISDKPSEVMAFGSIARVNGMVLFLSAALPKITLAEVSVLAVSPTAPLASALQGRVVGDELIFNGVPYRVEAIQ